MTDGSRRQVSGWRRWKSLALFGAAVLAWWVVPQFHPFGPYARRYHLVGLEIGIVAALFGLGWLGVALAPPRWRRPLALRLTAAFLAVLITAVACDLSYVIWTARGRNFWYYGQAFPYSSHTYDPELIWRFRPGFSFQGKSIPFSYDIVFRTDENGFRNPTGVRQADLVFVGDSVTMAAEVPEEATFVQKTAGQLGLQAVNLGIFCYGPQQELAVLKRFGLAYRPRTVVWQVTEWNDCQDAERYLKREHPEKPRMPPWLDLYETYSPIARRLGKVFHRRNRTNFHLVKFRRSDGKIDIRRVWAPDDAPATPTGLDALTRTISAARAFCRERGIEFVVLFVPSHTRVLSPYVLSERDKPPEGPSALSVALADLCRRLDCPMIDLYEPLCRRAETDNRHLYIIHDPHLDLDGHDEAARQLAARLATMGAVARIGDRPAPR